MRSGYPCGERRRSAAVWKLAAGVAVMLGMGAAAHAHQTCPDGLEPAVEYRMFFGLESADGRTVGKAEWRRFLTDVITPRFPAGLTVLDGRGQWLRPDGVTEHEAVKVVIGAVASREGPEMKLVDEISTIWLEAMGQDAVFRMAARACSGLHDAARSR